MVIAGEASGDLLAAELVHALRQEFNGAEAVRTPDYQPLHSDLEPRFFGAGGPCMAAAGVKLAFDMTEHSVIGIIDALKNYPKFRRLFHRLYRLALERQPDAIICVDFSGFNRRFAHAIRAHVRSRRGWFHDWNPKIIQYVSPQVWASREERASQLARDYDLLLSIIPFEKAWYAKRVPRFQVEFVGHPLLDRYPVPNGCITPAASSSPLLLMLPGSRRKELNIHLPIMLGALSIIASSVPNFRALMVLPNANLAELARGFTLPTNLQIQTGGLADALAQADVAIASSGTVTLECAYFGLPTVAMYKSSWLNYEIAKRVVKVSHLAMPNLLANEEIFPEFIQQAATAENIARAAVDLLRDGKRRADMKKKLADVIQGLGTPGANQRAAQSIIRLVEPNLVTSDR
jgi:lipid-A-disaccharide synthase